MISVVRRAISSVVSSLRMSSIERRNMEVALLDLRETEISEVECLTIDHDANNR
jgi:hypothetical protein